MITIKLPVVVDASVLRMAFEAAHKANTEVRIETFFRIIHNEMSSIDCESQREVLEYAIAFGIAQRSQLAPKEPVKDDAVREAPEQPIMSPRESKSGISDS